MELNAEEIEKLKKFFKGENAEGQSESGVFDLCDDDHDQDSCTGSSIDIDLPENLVSSL